MVTAFYKYKTVAYDVKIDIFVTQKFYYLDDPKYLGWKKYASGGVHSYYVSAGHDDMFENLHIKEIADLLQTRMNEINKPDKE